MSEDGPQSEYTGIAAAFAKAKADQEAKGLRPRNEDSKAYNKQQERQFKRSLLRLIGFLSLIFLLHVSGIYLFTSGFLLTRLVLDNKSDCAVLPTDVEVYRPGSPATGCWHPKTFEKAVVIIVDALRYDFTVPFNPASADSQPHHFHNALPVFYETASQRPNNAFLLPFIADPPTTTLQRLKGLTTGTLPTFIDAGSNFAGTAIDEDNLVAQLRNASKTIVHLGDDTWHSLFPGYFEPNLTRAYDSFNVWDLHTVDNGVTEHLLPLLNPANSSKWDVVFGHYLGVDHAGHRYGPDHPAMAAKLRQMDDVFRKVIDLIDDETLLVVMGDHGMDAKGDHGGESADEIEAALWMYSKKGIFGRSSPEFVQPPATAKDRPVAQIDLVPTLSLLLGMPIPFNNLGAPIEEAFIGKDGQDFSNLAQVNRLTAAQIYRYQYQYALARESGDSATSAPLALFDVAYKAFESTKRARSSSQADWRSVSEAFTRYQKETLRVCRGLWASFDTESMYLGIGILVFTLVLLAIYARGNDGDVTDVTPVLLVRGGVGAILGSTVGLGFALALAGPSFHLVQLVVGCAIFVSGAGIALALAYVRVGGAGINSAFADARQRLISTLPSSKRGWLQLAAILSAVVGVCLGFAASFPLVKSTIICTVLVSGAGMISALRFAKRRLVSPLPASIWGWMAVLFPLLLSIGFASNSFTIWEDEILLYFLGTCGVLFLVSSFRQADVANRVLGIYHSILFTVLTRVASLSRLCREEQMPYCVSTYYASATSSTSAGWQLVIPLVLALVLPTVIKSYYKSSLNYQGAGVMWIGFAFRFGLVLSAVFWMLDAGDDGDWFEINKDTLKTIKVIVAQVVLAVAFAAGYSTYTWSAPLLAIGTTADVLAPDKAKSQAIVSLPGRAAITILGYANLHGTRYFLLATIWALGIILLQKPMGGGAIGLCVWQILSLLEIIDTNKLSRTPVGPVVLGLMGSFYFFKTGHQASLSSIQWESAFIPLKSIRYPWSPVLVLLNTFGAQILCAVAVPATALWKKQPKQRGLLGDVVRTVATHILFYAGIALATMMWAGWLRRHLMLFRIFSPRFMMGAVVLLVVDVVSVFVALGGTLWSFLSVAEVFGWP
ncbi:mannose-ethanolamine phosphotransferase gpi13 [Coniosporium tulheliwenetii]|uniref:Mannose-ethanolamine phosphotransferase gpi13 n=1 Tax=Coniosporium tulheliwenetii TaxID=3383036 RepID=A0ACC2Z2V5_9PEZI|nr:mannose-ethanolamine phosphotransferase gpi13 [Cladosporium sp. JES 115]